MENEENHQQTVKNTKPVAPPPTGAIVSSTSASAISEAPKKKSKAPLIITFVALAVLLLGGGAYYYFVLREKPVETVAIEEAEKQEVPSDVLEPEDLPETEITDEATISFLFNRLYTLHNPYTSPEQSMQYQWSTTVLNKSFDFAAGYTVSENLYPDASELSNRDKLFIVVEYLGQSGNRFSSIYDFGVPQDFYLNLYPEYCSNEYILHDSSSLCYGETGVAISEEDVALTFRELFGSEPKMESPTNICGTLAYSAEYHIFYEQPSECGGYDPLIHDLYIEKYTEKGNFAYIYVRLDSVVDNNTVDASIRLMAYNRYYKHEDLWHFDETSGRSVLTEPDPTSIYRTSETYDRKISEITDENYASFEPYRFVFVKSGDNYVFRTVEKL